MPTRTELDQAYRATTYRVFLPGGAVDLRVDAANPPLAAWLRAHGVDAWVILTAANPGSQALPARENAERQARLECALLEAGYEPFAGENAADDGRWPVEESCFIPRLSVADGMAWACRFGQNALVAGGGDAVPRLIWTESTRDE